MSLLPLLAPKGEPLIEAMAKAGIASPMEQAHFLAQVAHESGGFRLLVEGLSYSAVRLQRMWPSRFSIQAAADYAHKPEQIANRAYCNRLGNGPERSGDGWRFRGRGFMQLTFRDNYAAASRRIFGDDRLVRNPDLAADPAIAAATACDYWTSRHLSIHARKDDLEGCTRGVNGGLTGIEDRRTWLIRFKAQLGVE